MAINPLQYKQHLRLNKEYLKALETILAHRASYLSYITSQRILSKEGLSLSRTDYYNLHRGQQKANEVNNEFEALIYALDEADFTYACKADTLFNEADKSVNRQIQQIWISLNEQIRLAQRFIADFILLSDDTFSTNALNLTLIIMIML
jgi:hypothetical protein